MSIKTGREQEDLQARSRADRIALSYHHQRNCGAEQHIRRVVKDDYEVLLRIPVRCCEDLLAKALADFVAEDV